MQASQPRRTKKPLNPDYRAIAGRNPLRSVARSLSVALAKVWISRNCQVIINERADFLNERADFLTFINKEGRQEPPHPQKHELGKHHAPAGTVIDAPIVAVTLAAP